MQKAELIHRMYQGQRVPSERRLGLTTLFNLNQFKIRQRQLRQHQLQNQLALDSNASVNWELFAEALQRVLNQTGIVHLQQDVTAHSMDQLALAWMTLRHSTNQVLRN